jgi:hypothetical protein
MAPAVRLIVAYALESDSRQIPRLFHNRSGVRPLMGTARFGTWTHRNPKYEFELRNYMDRSIVTRRSHGVANWSASSSTRTAS